ncbi:MAG: DsrE/DsrF/DrsH-like family protein [Acidimicrobiales bacterium]|nr:DsrE/DsrF/DrsH-like family protein [Acidimicrobiales bacterium]
MGSEPIEKVSIIISKGSLDGVYPGLIMANGARAEGIEANLFFTFFGLDAIHKQRMETHMMEKKMTELDIPDIPEFIELISDTGAGLYACLASVDMFGFTKDDFIDQLDDIITVGEFYEKAAGGQIIFT